MSDNAHVAAIREAVNHIHVFYDDEYGAIDHVDDLDAILAHAAALDAARIAAEAELTRLRDGITAGMHQDALAAIRKHAAAMRRTPYRDQQVLADHEAAIGDQLAVIAHRLTDAPGDTNTTLRVTAVRPGRFRPIDDDDTPEATPITPLQREAVVRDLIREAADAIKEANRRLWRPKQGDTSTDAEASR